MKKNVLSYSPWQIVQIARHPQRPHTLDYINFIFEDFLELKGDRLYGDDPAIIGGLAKFNNETIMIIGHQKGKNLEENRWRNFGMPCPEGYRKALRLMELAEKFNQPVVTFIDTPGAYPGVESEERGQAMAIANNLKAMFSLVVPTISVVIGEGGSGGALAIGLADCLLMLENAIYSVISPEGCASILWKDSNKNNAEKAAQALKLTAQDALRLGLIDEIIPEPPEGAHEDPEKVAHQLFKSLKLHLNELLSMDKENLLAKRYEKYIGIGEV